ncbi:Cytochrome P450 86A1 [Monoraphidium neglectum]|uniref:Cytochrome P450 86A1 n=1 Tax=Monoraphidium neglectum TaxID=145388 RepID=A0A0D2KHL7_9CHLO|nr:Cytochrome P450 86A1 [Monoraphidium neglectum]KIY95308.1 Cytochrome P450 86A1 [Monoraphidium neglectum]|eukprot:XP_013894328.1 Cytochrome P450 86A1 [Monoraphidium neglectum]
MHRVHDWAVEHQRGIGRGGATLAFTVPFLRTFYCITDPAVLEWVLKTRMTNFVKGEVVRTNMGPLLGSGIFAVDGEEWRWQRKLAARIFSVSRCAEA